MKGIEGHSRYAIVLLGITLLLGFIVVRPFLNAILAAIILSYIFYPVHRWLNARIRRESLAAFIITLMIIVLILLPSIFVVNALSREVFAGYIFAKQYISPAEEAECSVGVSCLVSNLINSASLSPQARDTLEDNLGRFAGMLFSKLSNAIFALPTLLINLFIIFFATYYLLKDGKKLVHRVKYVIPLKKTYQNAMVERFNDVTYAVVFGNVIVAFLQGVLAGIGYFIFGAASPILFGLVTFFIALIPFLGPFVVWLPFALLLLANGYVLGDNLMVLRGMGLFIYGTVIVSGVDNVLKPKIISQRAQVHPVLVLLGVIGGLTVFGVIGIVLGPVLLALADTAIDIFGKEKKASRRR